MCTNVFIEMIKNLPEWSEVRVRWRDAHAPHSGWHEIDEYDPKDQIAVTTGKVWKDCQEHYLTLVGTYFETESGVVETVGDINHIPLSCIVEIIRR